MGYCQDLGKEVEFNDNSVDFLTTDGTEIVVATPQSDSYIGDQKGTFIIKDTRFVNGYETITIALKVSFDIKIALPICSTIRLFVPTLESMEIEFGDDGQATQALPTLDDEYGLLRLGYCNLSITLKVNEQSVPFLTKTDYLIVLGSPASNAYLGNQNGQYIISIRETGFELMTIPFSVFIDDPNCRELRMIKPGALDSMSISLGDIASYP